MPTLFRKIGAAGALYYIDTQRIGLALERNDMATVRNLLSKATNPNHIEPDMLHIRNKYLQEFYEKTADYKNAFFYQKENSRLDDSIRNEHVRMRTADMSLRYQQDSTLLAKNILIEQQKVEMLKLHEGRFFWIEFAFWYWLLLVSSICMKRKDGLFCSRKVSVPYLLYVWRIYVTECHRILFLMC